MQRELQVVRAVGALEDRLRDVRLGRNRCVRQGGEGGGGERRGQDRHRHLRPHAFPRGCRERLRGIEGDARSGAGNRALRVARAPLRGRPRKTQGGGAPARPLQPRNRAVALPVALHDAHAGRQARHLARREEAWFPDLLRRHNRNGRDGRAARRVRLCAQGNRA